MREMTDKIECFLCKREIAGSIALRINDEGEERLICENCYFDGELDFFSVMTGGQGVKVPVKIVASIISTELSNKIYWMHNGMLTKEEVKEFFDYRLANIEVIDYQLVQKVAYYTLFYSENIVFTTYLGMKARGEDTKEYLEENLEMCKKLRWSKSNLDNTSDVKEATGIVDNMINVCLDYGTDPM